MGKGNTFRNKPNDDFEKESKKEEKDLIEKAGWKDIVLLKDERARKISGLLLLFFSIFMLLAFTSFFFTWKADQNLIVSFSWSDYLRINPEAAQNWLGIIGAQLAHFFVMKGFGVSAYAFVLILFVVGLKLLINIQILPIFNLLKYALFVGVWLSILFAYFFSGSWSILGGTFGYSANLYLNGLMGTAGTGMFVFLYLLVFLVIVFNINFLNNKVLQFFSKREKPIVEAENEEEKINQEIEDEIDQAEAEAYDFEAATLRDMNEEESTTHETEPLQEEKEEDNEEEQDLAFISSTTDPIKEEVLAKAPPVAGPIVLDDGSGITLEVERMEEKEEEISIQPKQEMQHYGLDTEFDPRLELSNYEFPTIDLLKDYGQSKTEVDTAELESNKNLIVETLKNYNISISQIKAAVGPTVTLYEIVPEAGVRISKIKNLEDDIALSLAALGIRIIAPIPGRGTIGIEVPNKKPEMVPMRTVIASSKFQNSDMILPVILGKTISNEIFIADLTKMPHLLMAGATGQGKSVGINALLISLLYKKHPAEVKFVLVDPKKVELTLYRTIERHFLAKLPGDGEAIITDTKLVTNTLNSLCVEMDKRYDLLKAAGVRNIVEYNERFLKRKLLPTEGHHFMPYIVVVIDELADLMMTAGKEVEFPIARLAQLARAIGIHLIVATQRPSVNVITGTIKANFPGRIAFRVTSKIDSRTILDGNGADQLIGKGDMLYSNGNDLIRLQCPFVDTPEVEEITAYIGNQRGYGSAFILPEAQDPNGESGHEEFDLESRDALFDEAARLVVQTQQGSTSLLQRRLKLGYNRAGRLIDQLEIAGVVGPSEGSKAREVRVRDELELEQLLRDLDDLSQ